MLLLLTLWAAFKRGQMFTLGVLYLLQRALEQFRGKPLLLTSSPL